MLEIFAKPSTLTLNHFCKRSTVSEVFIAEVKSNPDFIKLERHLMHAGFSKEGGPTVYMSRLYNLRDWTEKVQAPFYVHVLREHLDLFESRPLVNVKIFWSKSGTPEQMKTAISNYVFLPADASSSAVTKSVLRIYATIFQAEKEISHVSVDPHHNIRTLTWEFPANREIKE